MLSKSTVNRKLEELKSDIDRIDLKEVTALNVNSKVCNFLISLERLFNRYTVGGRLLEYISKYKVEKSLVQITLRSKLRDKHSYTKNIRVGVDNVDFSKIIKEEAFNILKSIYKAHLAEENILELNKVLDSINEFSDVSMYFAISGKTVEDIANKYVVFGLEIDQALNIPELYLFDNLNAPIYKSAVSKQIRICQTPAQMIKYENEILKDLGVYTKSRVEILLRYTYSRKYQHLGKVGVGYILEDSFISLIEVTEEGERVKLHPIDLKTYLFLDRK